MKRVLVAAGLLLGLAIVAVPAQAQTGTLRGTVVDQENKGIADVKVVIDFTGGLTRKFETKSNARGEFLQVGIPSGNYNIKFSKDGFRDFVLPWRISIGVTELPQPVVLEKGASSQQAEAIKKLQVAFKEAVELTNAGKYDEAIAGYQAILAQNAQIAAVHKNLGFVYVQKKDYPAAEAAYLEVLDLEPADPDALLALAGIYNAMGQKDKAKAMLDQATEANPGDPKAQLKKGIFLRNANDNDGALQAFQAVLEAEPNNVDALFNLGQLMVGAAKFPEAIQYLEKYLSFKPTNEQQIATAKGLIQALKK
jgi:tetratricopeptide (TPR) repeat protein